MKTFEAIKKEAGIGKGAGNREEPAGDISLDKVIKIAKEKENTLAGDLKAKVNEVLGSCLSMGVTVDGKNAREVIAEVNEGKHDSVIKG